MSEWPEESQATGTCRAGIVCVKRAYSPTLVSKHGVKGNVQGFYPLFRTIKGVRVDFKHFD